MVPVPVHGNSVQKSTSRLWMAKKFLDSIGGGGYNRILFNLPHDELSALWADSSHLCARRFPNGVLTLPGLPARAVSGPLSHPRPLQRLGGFLGMDHTAHA